MKLTGRLIRGTECVQQEVVERQEGDSFRDTLEESLISLCRELDIPVPIWLRKNTRELAAYRKTFFVRDQFLEKIWFDKFEITFEY